jgi:hypothetical protein
MQLAPGVDRAAAAKLEDAERDMTGLSDSAGSNFKP